MNSKGLTPQERKIIERDQKEIFNTRQYTLKKIELIKPQLRNREIPIRVRKQLKKRLTRYQRIVKIQNEKLSIIQIFIK